MKIALRFAAPEQINKTALSNLEPWLHLFM